MKKRFLSEQLLSLVSINRNDLVSFVSGKNVNIKGMLPSLLYRIPLFDKDIRSVSIDTIDISLQSNHKGLLEMLEFISLFSRMQNGCITADIPLSLIPEEKETSFYEAIRSISYLSIMIKEGEYQYSSISLIESVSLLQHQQFYHIAFSSGMSYLYLTDYLVSYASYKHILKMSSDHTRSILRFCLSMPYSLSKGLTFSSLVSRNIVASEFVFPSIEREMEVMGDILSQIGLRLDKKNRKIYYDPLRYSVPQKPKYDFNHLEEKEAPDSGYIDFLTLSLNDKMKRKALEYGMNDQRTEDLFKVFVNTYSTLPQKYKSAYRVWCNFLKKELGDQSKKPNRGDPKNITLNDDIIKIAEENGLDSVETSSQFKMFKNYYVSQNRKKANWLPLWENWVIRGKMRKEKEEVSGSMRTVIETQFDLSQRVSKDIESMLSEQDINPVDIIRKRVEVNEIGYKTHTVPPSFGKGEVTLFYFKDPMMQQKMLSRYTGTETHEQNVYDVFVLENT